MPKQSTTGTTDSLPFGEVWEFTASDTWEVVAVPAGARKAIIRATNQTDPSDESGGNTIRIGRGTAAAVASTDWHYDVTEGVNPVHELILRPDDGSAAVDDLLLAGVVHTTARALVLFEG